MTAPIFEMSADARLLRQRLKKIQVGETITYDELSKEISQPVDGSFQALQSARRSLLNHDNYVFETIMRVGLKRLSDSEIVSASERDVSKIRRAAKKGAKKLTSVQNYAGLSNDVQLQHTTRLSVFGLIAHAASDKGIEKVSQKAAGRTTELPIADTISAFMPKAS